MGTMPFIYTEDWLDQPVSKTANILLQTIEHPEITWVLISKRLDQWRIQLQEVRDFALHELQSEELHGLVHQWLDRYTHPLQPTVPQNIWLGVPVSKQSEADVLIPQLLQIRASKRMVYANPMRTKLLLSHFLGKCVFTGGTPYETGAGIDWVVAAGGKSPLHPDWVRQLRDDCISKAIPFQFLSWGRYFVPEDGAQACRVCGCTWNNACGKGCYWAEPNLCSACVGKPIPLGDRPVKYQLISEGCECRHLDDKIYDEYP